MLRKEEADQDPLLSSLSTLRFEKDCSFLHYFLEPAEDEPVDDEAQSEDEPETTRRLELDRKSLFEGEIDQSADASAISSPT